MKQNAKSRDDIVAKSGQVILIPKQLRAEWMDVMAIDIDLSNTAFRVAAVIGSHFNRHSGLTFISHEKLALIMNLTERTVWAAIVELERRGYLIVQRRELGVRTDGRRVCGGKGVANTYLPAVDRVQVAATNTGPKLADRSEQLWKERTQKIASSKKHRKQKIASYGNSQRTQNSDPKDATDCDPTLSDLSDQNSSRARGPSSPNGLGPAGAALRLRLGSDVFDSWFGKIKIRYETAELIILTAPTRFLANRVLQDFEPQMLAAWRSVTPSVQRIEIALAENGE